MMLLLALDVSNHDGHAIAAHGKRAEAALPLKRANVLLVQPVRCGLLHASDDRRGCGCRIEPTEEMNVIVIPANVDVVDAEVPHVAAMNA